jgi:putative spermidine/putrescine transport system permease protein
MNQSTVPAISSKSHLSRVQVCALAGLTCFSVVPLVLLLVWSFARHWYWPDLLPREFSLRAWSYLAEPSSGIPDALLTSIGIALGVTILALAVSLPAARVLALDEFKGKQLIVFLLLLPVLAPPLASAMGLHALFLRLGLTDSWLGVLLVHLIPAVPYCTLMLMGSFANLDTDWEAQASTLGASPFAVWWHVTLPAIAPGLAVAASFAFLVSWSQYLVTLFIGGGRIITLPILLVAIQRGGDATLASALALVFLAPVLTVFVVVAHMLKPDFVKVQ